MKQITNFLTPGRLLGGFFTTWIDRIGRALCTLVQHATSRLQMMFLPIKFIGLWEYVSSSTLHALSMWRIALWIEWSADRLRCSEKGIVLQARSLGRTIVGEMPSVMRT